MEDVDKLDNIQDCFIHYQLIRFCQATRLQYLNGQVQLANQQVLQQQHVDHKIANALLKKGTREAYKTWTQQDRAWVDMRLHESHDEGSFGVPNNTISRHAAAYATNARFVAFLALLLALLRRFGCQATTSRIPPPGASPPLCTLKHLQKELLLDYNCVLDPRRHGSARTCSLHCTLTPAACAARSARSAPGQDTRSGQGALARRHTDGPLWAALLKTTVMCEAWRRRTIAPPDPCFTSF
jgi:hypothetical protein